MAKQKEDGLSPIGSLIQTSVRDKKLKACRNTNGGENRIAARGGRGNRELDDTLLPEREQMGERIAELEARVRKYEARHARDLAEKGELMNEADDSALYANANAEEARRVKRRSLQQDREIKRLGRLLNELHASEADMASALATSTHDLEQSKENLRVLHRKRTSYAAAARRRLDDGDAEARRLRAAEEEARRLRAALDEERSRHWEEAGRLEREVEASKAAQASAERRAAAAEAAATRSQRETAEREHALSAMRQRMAALKTSLDEARLTVQWSSSSSCGSASSSEDERAASPCDLLHLRHRRPSLRCELDAALEDEHEEEEEEEAAAAAMAAAAAAAVAAAAAIGVTAEAARDRQRALEQCTPQPTTPPRKNVQVSVSPIRRPRAGPADMGIEIMRLAHKNEALRKQEEEQDAAAAEEEGAIKVAGVSLDASGAVFVGVASCRVASAATASDSDSDFDLPWLLPLAEVHQTAQEREQHMKAVTPSKEDVFNIHDTSRRIFGDRAWRRR